METRQNPLRFTLQKQLMPVLIRSHVCEQEACDAVRGKQEVGDSVLADLDLWTLLEQLPLREFWWTINTHTHTHAYMLAEESNLTVLLRVGVRLI